VDLVRPSAPRSSLIYCASPLSSPLLIPHFEWIKRYTDTNKLEKSFGKNVKRPTELFVWHSDADRTEHLGRPKRRCKVSRWQHTQWWSAYTFHRLAVSLCINEVWYQGKRVGHTSGCYSLHCSLQYIHLITLFLLECYSFGKRKLFTFYFTQTLTWRSEINLWITEMFLSFNFKQMHTSELFYIWTVERKLSLLSSVLRKVTVRSTK
jgi:hypothetical protein